MDEDGNGGARRPKGFRAQGGIAVCAVALAMAVAGPLAGQERQQAGPPVLFSAPLAEEPGKRLVVVELSFAPHDGPASTLEQHRRGHRHPGSVYVYVTDGAVRLGVEGQPVQVVRAGGSFFEPAGAHHIITENASATDPARAIAVMIVPEGAPLVTPDDEDRDEHEHEHEHEHEED